LFIQWLLPADHTPIGCLASSDALAQAPCHTLQRVAQSALRRALAGFFCGRLAALGGVTSAASNVTTCCKVGQLTCPVCWRRIGVKSG